MVYILTKQIFKGLFQKAISQGGSSFNRWALQEYPAKMTQKLATGLGIQQTDTKELVKELQNINYKIIVKAAFNQSIVGFYTPYYAQPFAPIIETTSSTAFISESTFEQLLEGRIHNKVPYIAGFNTEEGTFGYYYINNSRVDIKIYETTPELLIPISMNISNKESKCRDDVLSQIVKFYFQDGPVTDKKNWINYMSQELFVRGIQKTVDMIHNFIPVYLYRFSYSGCKELSFLGGVGHHEEGKYIWRQPLNMSDYDMLTSKRMVQMWVNFASTGNPTPKVDEVLENVIWPKWNKNRQFLDFGRNLRISENPEQEHFEFWEKLWKECGNPPYNTH